MVGGEGGVDRADARLLVSSAIILGKVIMVKIKSSNIQPASSIILKGLNGEIHYMDSFNSRIENKNNYSIDYLTALLFSSVPKWAKLLLRIRDFIVKPFGLKTGLIPELKTLDKTIEYDIGDKLVFFPVIDRSKTEIVMSEDDKHLYFRSSFLIQYNLNLNHQSVHLTTIIRFHNISGRIYFAIIMPFHKLIMKTMLTSLCKTLQQIKT